MPFQRSITLLAFALLLGSTTALAQQNRYVTPFGDNQGGTNDCTSQALPCQTINHAVGQSDNGDSILISQGNYTETLALSNRQLTLIGQGGGPGGTVIQAHPTDPEQATARVLTVSNSANIKLEHIWIRNGNPSSSGGGISANNSTVTLVDSRVSDNIGTAGGGIQLINNATLLLSNSVLRDNLATSRGGGLDHIGNSVATIDGSEIIDNRSESHGGGIYAGSPQPLVITDSIVSGNEAGGAGGGISVGSPQSSSASPVTITGTGITGNTAAGNGGGIWSRGPITTAAGTLIDDNHSGGWGGGIYQLGESFHLAQATVSNNTAALNGGGILYSSSENEFLVNRSTIVGNSALGSGAHGWGGGIGMTSNARVRVVNSTITGNSATYGGAIRAPATGDAHLHLFNVTITQNASGGSFGAVYFPAGDDAETSVRNTIIADQAGITPDCNNPADSMGHNLASDSSCGFSAAGDIENGSARLLPLNDNGGATETHAMFSDSDAIGAGDPAVCAGPDVTNIDQRGVTRPQGTQCDIGALELGQVPVQIATTELEGGNEEQPYSQILEAAGGQPPYTWSIDSGALPGGLTLNTASGEIGGTPTESGLFEFAVQVSDDDAATATRDLSIDIAGLPPGFTIVHPGDQISGEPFAIDIVDARDSEGLLNGPVQIELDSNLEGMIFYEPVEFTDGAATIEGAVLNVLGTHDLEVDLGFVWQTIEVFVAGTAVIDIEFDGDGAGTVLSTPVGIDCHSANGGTGQCSAQFEGGVDMAVEAIPDTGSAFVEWCVVGEGCWGLDDNPLVFEPTSDLTIIAVFESFDEPGQQIFRDRFEQP